MRLIKGLLVLVTIGVGVAFPVNVNGIVNMSPADLLLLLAALVVVGQLSLRHLVPRSMGRLLALVALGGLLWLLGIGLSLNLAATRGYGSLDSAVLALAKPAIEVLYVIVPASGIALTMRMEVVAPMLNAWCVTAVCEVVAALVPGLGRPLWYYGARMSGLMTDPNLFGIYEAVAACLALALRDRSTGRLRHAYGFAFVACSAGVLLSTSRTAWAAFLGGLLLYGSARSARKLAGSLALAGGLILATGPLFANYALLGRLAPAGYHAGLHERLTVWAHGIAAFEASPLFGVGRELLPDWEERQGVLTPLLAHNSYIGALAETGIAGAGFFALLFVFVPLAVIARVRPPRAGFVAAYTVVLLGALGVNIENFRGGWLLVGICAALAAQDRHRATALPSCQDSTGGRRENGA
ncbi:MAG: O-antigen ligase family protein [Chloroflexi bacterium]|nr:O-antigen ligase family protein [Chloroflexota bacterium]